VELDPTDPSLDVGTASPAFNQVEMEERLTAHVEHVGFLLDDPGPGTNLGQQVVEVVEQLRGAVRHRSILAALRGSARGSLSCRCAPPAPRPPHGAHPVALADDRRYTP